MLAIIGGTGLYELSALQIEQRIADPNPFGTPLGEVLFSRLCDRWVLFLARHGDGHREGFEVLRR